MINAGEIGEIRHVRVTYLQDWLVDPKFPMNWRLRKDAAGSGANGDLGAHTSTWPATSSATSAKSSA